MNGTSGVQPFRKRSLLLAIGLAGLFVLLGLWNLRSDYPKPPFIEMKDEQKPIRSQSTNPGYLGPEACAQCHAQRVAEFQSTRHFVANKRPESGQMPEGFLPEKGKFSVEDLALRFEMSEQNGKFREAPFFDHSPQAPTHSSEIAFCYGAKGGNDEVYFTWHEDQLCELPVAWLDPLKMWGASPFDRHDSGDFARDTTVRCVECHNTWVEHLPGSRNQYRRDDWILGVTCEVCHGPGRDHVSFHQKNPLEKEPRDVVRPARLSRERRMDLCAQCHSNALKHRGPAFSYRPGEPLEDFYFSLRTSRPEDDHVANQTTYLRQSRCFQKSDSLTCVTCHNPHQPRSAANAGAASCQTCHANTDCSERIRLPNAVQDQCIQCHMPERRKIQVYFRTEKDKYVSPVKRYEHRIAVYPDAKDEVLLNWYRTQTDPESLDKGNALARSLGEFWRIESDKLSRDYRYLAAIDACRNSLQFDPAPDSQDRLNELISMQWKIDTDFQDGLWHEREGRYAEAIDAFERVLKVKPNHVNAHAKLGTTYAVVKQAELATKHLKAAADYDHDDPYAPGMLGWLAYLDGHPENALEYYRQAEDVEPYSAKINYQMGLALAKLDRFPEAADRYKKAIQIDPGNVSSLATLSQLLLKLGKPDEAMNHSLKAVEVTGHRDPEILMNLAESYAGTQEFQNAITTAQRALELSNSRPREFQMRIRDRIDQFKSSERNRSKPPKGRSKSR